MCRVRSGHNTSKSVLYTGIVCKGITLVSVYLQTSCFMSVFNNLGRVVQNQTITVKGCNSALSVSLHVIKSCVRLTEGEVMHTHRQRAKRHLCCIHTKSGGLCGGVGVRTCDLELNWHETFRKRCVSLIHCFVFCSRHSLC